MFLTIFVNSGGRGRGWGQRCNQGSHRDGDQYQSQRRSIKSIVVPEECCIDIVVESYCTGKRGNVESKMGRGTRNGKMSEGNLYF